MSKRYLRTVYTGFCLFMGFLITPCSSFADSYSKAKEIGQEHLLEYWNVLSTEERQELLEQIDSIEEQVFFAQRETVVNPQEIKDLEIAPFTDFDISGSNEHFVIGKKIIAEGQAGCLLIAGGQGTRLGCNGPKGLYPVTIVKNKSLFQLVAEKVLAASRQANRPLFLAIMTSSVNHEETFNFFEDHNYFGLDKNQVYFFSQTDLPFLNSEGNLFLETRSKLAAGPDGNAASLKHFVSSNIWSEWYEKGVRYINYIPIDNPLADPFDAELIGFHHQQQSDLVIKCIKRENPSEKVGVILKNHQKVNVIEYSEITAEERDARSDDGNLKHLCCNISLFSFKMEFVKEIADEHYNKFPFHKAWKAAKYLNELGETKTSEQPMAWKFEKFIFDLLPYAQTIKALLYPREVCFAPLKNAQGADSIVNVQASLQKFDRETIAKITGIMPSENQKFELHPQFYYPTEELLAKWKGSQLPEQAYIEP
jgi:UDP-N-acetylglucosamine/UDP-N-acetylgalactosamine diphosphorylase